METWARTVAVGRIYLFSSWSWPAPKVGFGLDGSAADDPGGAELRSMAPPEVSALAPDGCWGGFIAFAASDPGGAELRSRAPPDVSAWPDGGLVADSAASGVVAVEAPADVPPVELLGFAEVSAAKAGVSPSKAATAVQIRRRFIGVSSVTERPCTNASGRTEFLMNSQKSQRAVAREPIAALGQASASGKRRASCNN